MKSLKNRVSGQNKNATKVLSNALMWFFVTCFFVIEMFLTILAVASKLPVSLKMMCVNVGEAIFTCFVLTFIPLLLSLNPQLFLSGLFKQKTNK